MAPRPEELNLYDPIYNQEQDFCYRNLDAVSRHLQSWIEAASQRLETTVNIVGFLLDRSGEAPCVHPVVGYKDRRDVQHQYALGGKDFTNLYSLSPTMVRGHEGVRVAFFSERRLYYKEYPEIIKKFGVKLGSPFYGMVSPGDESKGEKWRMFLKFQEGNWLPTSVAEIRKELMELMFFPDTVITFIKGLKTAGGIEEELLCQ